MLVNLYFHPGMKIFGTSPYYNDLDRNILCVYVAKGKHMIKEMLQNVT